MVPLGSNPEPERGVPRLVLVQLPEIFILLFGVNDDQVGLNFTLINKYIEKLKHLLVKTVVSCILPVQFSLDKEIAMALEHGPLTRALLNEAHGEKFVFLLTFQ